MHKMTLSKLHMFCAWSMVLYLIGLAGGWLTAGFMPPLDPSATEETIVQYFEENTTRVRIGMIIAMFGAMFYIPWTALVCRFHKQLEGGFGVLSASQLVGGYTFGLLTFLPPLWWLFATYREEQLSTIVYFVNDAAFLSSIGGYALFIPMLATIVFSAFVDKSPQPVFPRWMGYFTLWAIIAFMPSQLIFFFYDGVFAWDGLFAFWIGVSVYFPWAITAFVLVRKAVLREREQLLVIVRE